MQGWRVSCVWPCLRDSDASLDWRRTPPSSLDAAEDSRGVERGVSLLHVTTIDAASRAMLR
jgi:hypothetical protein